MRKWADLKADARSMDGTSYRRIMIYSYDEGTYVFLYESEDSVCCSEDEWYETEEDALDAWEDQIDQNGWHVIDDPLPGAQQDTIPLESIIEKDE